MNILLDTNIALDSILARQPFCANAMKILSLANAGQYKAFVSASAVTDIYYISKRTLKDATIVMARLKDFLSIVEIATVSSTEIHKAIELKWDDFEDCVQFTVGERLPVQYIVTRDPDGFSASSIPVIAPDQFIAMITAFSR